MKSIDCVSFKQNVVCECFHFLVLQLHILTACIYSDLLCDYLIYSQLDFTGNKKQYPFKKWTARLNIDTSKVNLTVEVYAYKRRIFQFSSILEIVLDIDFEVVCLILMLSPL